MEVYFIAAGFLMASYSVVGNDVIQTLGTFLSSNKEKPWWVLWLYTASILTMVLLIGWFEYGGDVSYGRLEKIGPRPFPFEWWYAIPPFVLVLITRAGIPVSTTFLILSVFKPSAIESMVLKSAAGYVVAFFSAIFLYYFISEKVERRFIANPLTPSTRIWWTVAQWFSTGFLWSQWLIQDLANIYVYLDRPLNFQVLLITLLALVGLQGVIFAQRGGRIQQVVQTKTATADIRSATIIDLVYGLVLLLFKEISNIPMSTTWVFVGLLAGREVILGSRLGLLSAHEIFQLVLRDFVKVLLGLLVSVALVFLIRAIQ